MKTKVTIVVLAMMFSLNACASNWVELDVLVHEEDGTPVEGADVKGLFYTDEIKNGAKRDSHTDTTNNEGMAKVAGEEEIYVDLVVSKQGYYPTTKRKVVNKENRGLVDILLRPKRNPIAMYAKRFKGFIPVDKMKVGYDFAAGDWVSPYGTGLNKDILFLYDGYSNSFTDFSGVLTISFNNESDGLFDLEYDPGFYSELKLPYEAPESGYRSKKVLVYKRKGKGSNTVKENNLTKTSNFGYFLRVNSKRDESGKIVQANYVKIGGEFIFDPRTEGKGAAYITMTYYYNPTPNDRNLEFDPDKNLFKNLKPEERPRLP